MVQLRPQVHEDIYEAKNGFGVKCEWIDGHTYEVDPENPTVSMALIDVHGSNMDGDEHTVELWLRAEEIQQIIEGLQKLVVEDPPPAPKTTEEKIAFRKEWDKRYEEARNAS